MISDHGCKISRRAPRHVKILPAFAGVAGLAEPPPGGAYQLTWASMRMAASIFSMCPCGSGMRSPA